MLTGVKILLVLVVRRILSNFLSLTILMVVGVKKEKKGVQVPNFILGFAKIDSPRVIEFFVITVMLLFLCIKIVLIIISLVYPSSS